MGGKSNTRGITGAAPLYGICLLLGQLSVSTAVLAQSAQPPISLEPTSGANLYVKQTFTVMGKCGSASVKLSGFGRGSKNIVVNHGDGRIDVAWANGKKLVMGGGFSDNKFDAGLQDYDGIACVHTAQGTRLLVWSNCGGSACGDRFSFYVIDADNGVFLAPQNPKRPAEQCEEICAAKALGSDLPHEVNAAWR